MEWLQKLFSHYRYVVSLNKLIGFDIRGHKRSGITKSQEIDFLLFALFIFALRLILNHGSVIVRVSLMEILNIMAHGSVKFRHQPGHGGRKKSRKT